MGEAGKSMQVACRLIKGSELQGREGGRLEYLELLVLVKIALFDAAARS